MSKEQHVPLGLRLRRARERAGLSQNELAKRAKVSQPLVSYYERSAGEPESHGIQQIAAALGVTLAAPRSVESSPSLPPGAGMWLSHYRTALLRTLEQCDLEVAVLDQPAIQPGGDVAFSVDLGSHQLIAVLDGTGGGEEACVASLLESAAILGATTAQRGVLWPDQLFSMIRSLSDRLGSRTLASAFVSVVDRKHGELSWALDRFPGPWIRSGPSTLRLGGEPTGQIQVGRAVLAENWLLLVATDGIAHSPSRRENTLWDTRDVRQLVSRARGPAELLQLLSKRLSESPIVGQADDRLALAVTGQVRT